MKGAGWRERGLVFACGGHRLVGVATLPEAHDGTAVLILVGGPQYRVGSHRQFTLLARDLAEQAIPSLRFDYSGMGDSEGEQREFSDVEEDIACAIDALMGEDPTIKRIVLWGLCDAASAAMMYAHRHTAICSMVLLNPWVHGVEYSPQVKLSHYYRSLATGSSGWRRLLSGKVNVAASIKEFLLSSVRTIAGSVGLRSGAGSRHSFVDRMLNGFSQYDRSALIVLSENDLTAKEFATLAETDRAWRRLLARPGIESRMVADADHTFSGKQWRGVVSSMTCEWVKGVIE
ncbi:MAG: hydrolase 1, exosortase A system-associated [Gammaproteobacteria bacterium]|jgi:exosortase A-associated hydrolase 1|nr:hydrolase 1, exosortase A system-associated [Gammaproteobacteria bacterium]